MKLQVTQENLNRALAAVARVASSRGTLPILANVALKTVENRLSVSATNLDIAVDYFVGAKIEREGSITVPAKLLADFVASLPSGVINLTLSENKLEVSTAGYTSTINGISMDDFPTMPKIDDGKKVKIKIETLRSALNQTVIATSNDETRPVLTGVYLFGGDSLTIAATDSYRLAEKKIGAKTVLDPIIIPANAITELLKITSQDEGEVSLNYTENQVNFSTSDAELSARLIDGKFPPYQNLIPSKFAVSAELALADLNNIVKVSSLFARESAGSITIDVDAESQKLSVHSIASQLGENTASADAKVTGSGSITLNSRYILDGLSAMTGAKNVTISFNGKLEPVVLRSKDDKNYLHLVMPLKS